MVDIIGHLGMALIWLTVGEFVYERRAALGFVAIGLPFGLVPDTDLWLEKVFPTVHHHGITHTILFVTLASVVVGAAVGKWVVPKLEGKYVPQGEIGNEYAYAIGALWVGGLSHLFADMLSAPDVASPIEPFWPLAWSEVITMDLVWYNSTFWNWGFFLTGLALTLGFWWARR